MDREALAKLAARYTRRAEPVSLTPEELDLEHCKVTRVVPGVPVWQANDSGTGTSRQANAQ